MSFAIQARNAQLSKRKSTNRDAEKASGVAENAVPQGKTPWERAISVINFNMEGATTSKDPFKELSRYKGVLLTCKKMNMPISA